MDDTFDYMTIAYVAGPVLLLLMAIMAAAWRVVVPTNVVHIVQSRGRTTSYGRGQAVDEK